LKVLYRRRGEKIRKKCITTFRNGMDVEGTKKNKKEFLAPAPHEEEKQH
jgi:hypothetical protein